MTKSKIIYLVLPDSRAHDRPRILLATFDKDKAFAFARRKLLAWNKGKDEFTGNKDPFNFKGNAHKPDQEFVEFYEQQIWLKETVSVAEMRVSL
jgi:hypothetical protein